MDIKPCDPVVARMGREFDRVMVHGFCLRRIRLLDGPMRILTGVCSKLENHAGPCEGAAKEERDSYGCDRIEWVKQ